MYPHGWNILYLLLLFIVWLDLNVKNKLWVVGDMLLLVAPAEAEGRCAVVVLVPAAPAWSGSEAGEMGSEEGWSPEVDSSSLYSHRMASLP